MIPATKEQGGMTKRGDALTPAELSFLDTLTDPLAEGDIVEEGRKCGLREQDVRFIEEWVISQGVHWLTCERAEMLPLEGARVFRNPLVRKVINAAAERGFCVATSAAKEELEDFYSQRMRNPILPEAVQDNAADKLAKLKGFYPNDKGNAGGAAIQINFVNPYADSNSGLGIQATPVSGVSEAAD